MSPGRATFHSIRRRGGSQGATPGDAGEERGRGGGTDGHGALVSSRFDADDGSGERDCAAIPESCVVGVVTTDGTTLLAKALEPIGFHPHLEGTGRRNLTDGDTVHLTGRFFPPGDYTAAQRDRASLDDPTPAQAEARCGPASPVTSGPGARRRRRGPCLLKDAPTTVTSTSSPLGTSVSGSTSPCCSTAAPCPGPSKATTS